jgi:hypothetical protein
MAKRKFLGSVALSIAALGVASPSVAAPQPSSTQSVSPIETIGVSSADLTLERAKDKPLRMAGHVSHSSHESHSSHVSSS